MQEFKVQAFADDVLLIIEDPESSLQEIIRRLEDYQKFAGF